MLLKIALPIFLLYQFFRYQAFIVSFRPLASFKILIFELKLEPIL